jgi:hypothetical protein
MKNALQKKIVAAPRLSTIPMVVFPTVLNNPVKEKIELLFLIQQSCNIAPLVHC